MKPASWSFLTSAFLLSSLSRLFFYATGHASLNNSNLWDITLGWMVDISIVVHANKSLLTLSTFVKAHSCSLFRLLPTFIIQPSYFVHFSYFSKVGGIYRSGMGASMIADMKGNKPIVLTVYNKGFPLLALVLPSSIILHDSSLCLLLMGRLGSLDC